MTKATSGMTDTSPALTPPLAGAPWSRAWLRARLNRHGSEMVRLALPAMATRFGLWAIALVDTAIVGNYATDHLAWLNLANQSVIMVIFVVAIGLLMGVQIQVSQAFGAGDYEKCGQIWRRCLPFTLMVGAGVVAICLPGPFWLTLIGVEEPLASKSGDLIRILCLGLPFHLLFVQTTMFFEGINRALVGAWVMLAANVVNLIADLVLVTGWGIGTPLGAEGAAWASTLVRITMALGVAGYLWFSPSLAAFKIRKPVAAKWAEWQDQRRLGYATALSMLAEITAFSALAVFAGYIGTKAVASHGIIFTMIGVPLMLSIGIASATNVRVGIAVGRKDLQDAALAGLVGVGFCLLTMIGFALVFFSAAEPFASLFTQDDAVITLIVPIAAIFTTCMVFDAGQMVASAAIRGLGEVWWPTLIMVVVFEGVMIPLSYTLGIGLNRGVGGLFEATLIACTLALVLLVLRFIIATREPASIQEQSQHP